VPSVSKKQHNLMAMVANDPAAAKRMGIPQSVGAEFMKADKGRKFGTGSRADIQAINKPKTEHGKSAILARGGDVKESKAMMKKEVGFMKKAGAPKSMIKHEMAEMKGKKMAVGGGISNLPTPAKPGGFSTGVKNKLPPGGRPGTGNRPGGFPGGIGPGGDTRPPSERMKNGGNVKKMASGGITTAKMGSVRTAAPSRDGLAKKGTTKGTMVKMAASKPLGMKNGGMKKMNYGGKAC